MHCRGQSPNASKKILDLPIPPPEDLLMAAGSGTAFVLTRPSMRYRMRMTTLAQAGELEQSVADAGCFTKLGGVRDLIVAVVLLVIDTMRPAV